MQLSTVIKTGILVALFLSAFYIFFTVNGSNLLLQGWLGIAYPGFSIKVETSSGSLVQGLHWNRVSVRATDPEWLEEIAIDLAQVAFSPLLSIHKTVTVQDGRLILIKSQTVIAIDGVYGQELCDIDIKTSGVKIGDILNLGRRLNFFHFNEKFIRALAAVSDVKISFQGIHISREQRPKSGLRIDIFHGRLDIPDADVIFLDGGYSDNLMNLVILTKWIAIERVANVLGWHSLGKLSGTAEDVHLTLSGSILQPRITGNLSIEKLVKDGKMIRKVSGRIDLQMKMLKQTEIFGIITIKDGYISGTDTAEIRLHPGKLVFKGDPTQTALDLKGSSEVGKTKINILLKGTYKNPELKLESFPELPQDQLIIMVLTNRSWSGTEQFIQNQSFSINAATEFIDYFAFGSMGNKLLRGLGVSDVSVTLDKTKKGVGLTKEMTSRLDAKYSLEQSQSVNGQPLLSVQKFGGDYKLNDFFSVEAEREVRFGNTDGQPADDDKFLLKYRRSF